MERVTIRNREYDLENGIYTPVDKSSMFAQDGGTLRMEDGFLVENLDPMPEVKQMNYGMYGHRRREYLKDEKPSLFNELLLQGKLSQHLYEMDEQCYEREKQVEKDLKAAEGITESMKSTDWWKYVQAAERIHMTAQRMVLEEIVYD